MIFCLGINTILKITSHTGYHAGFVTCKTELDTHFTSGKIWCFQISALTESFPSNLKIMLSTWLMGYQEFLISSILQAYPEQIRPGPNMSKAKHWCTIFKSVTVLTSQSVDCIYRVGSSYYVVETILSISHALFYMVFITSLHSLFYIPAIQSFDKLIPKDTNCTEAEPGFERTDF